MVIAQLRGIYIDFWYNPCPHTYIASSIITIKVVHVLQLMGLHQYIIIPPKPVQVT